MFRPRRILCLLKTPNMNIEAFKNTLNNPEPPSHFSDLQQGLWYAAKGDWDAAHNIAQEHEGTKDFDHLHAHLHRVEGDDWNAGYWYRRAGVSLSTKSLSEELDELILQWS
jgi:hypothetical protein